LAEIGAAAGPGRDGLKKPLEGSMEEPMISREGAQTAWLDTASTHEHVAQAVPTAVDATAVTPAPLVTLPVDLPTLLRDLENAYIQAALAQTRSNKKEAAKLLGLGRTTLVEKLRRRAMVRSGP
jgi:DNA-binding NtrC family response regulator